MSTYNYELYHHGVKGMKWGIRRFQKKNGSLTPAGKRRYSDDVYDKKNAYKAAKKAYDNSPEGKARAAERRKKALKVGAAVAATALATYGAYKVNQYVKTKNCQIAAKKGYDLAMKNFDRDVAYFRKTGFSPESISERVSITSNSGYKAVNAAREAANDKFTTAAKNVINYKKSGGSLQNLHSTGFYERVGEGARVVFEKKRRY